MDKPTFSDIMKFLNNIFIPVFIPFAFWFIKEYIPKQIELGIQEKLQSRKSEFTKLEYNFQLYTQKQHKIFLEFHQLYCEAKGRIMYLTGVQSLPNFQTYTLKDLEIWFDQQKLVFLETDKKSILTLFETNKSASINKLHTLIDKMNERLAQNSLIPTTSLWKMYCIFQMIFLTCLKFYLRISINIVYIMENVSINKIFQTFMNIYNSNIK